MFIFRGCTLSPNLHFFPSKSPLFWFTKILPLCWWKVVDDLPVKDVRCLQGWDANGVFLKGRECFPSQKRSSLKHSSPSGSTIRTLLNGKINDVGFLLFFRVVSGDYGKPWPCCFEKVLQGFTPVFFSWQNWSWYVLQYHLSYETKWNAIFYQVIWLASSLDMKKLFFLDPGSLVSPTTVSTLG